MDAYFKAIDWQQLPQHSLVRGIGVGMGLLGASILYHTVRTRIERKKHVGEMIPVTIRREEIPITEGDDVEMRGKGEYTTNFHVVQTLHHDIESPTVVFEAGLGVSNLPWSLAQQIIAESFPTFSYDRAGLGFSSESPSDSTRDILTLVHELHSLLNQAKVRRPLVMVGHSLGGVIIRAYQALYPHEVAGLVLVDPSHEDMLERLKMKNFMSQARVIIGIMRSLASVGVFRALNMFGLIEKSILSGTVIDKKLIPSFDLYLKQSCWSHIIATSMKETRVLERSLNIMNSLNNRETISDDFPLAVLTATSINQVHPGITKEEYAENWMGLHKHLASLNTHPALIKANHILDNKFNHTSVCWSPKLKDAILLVTSLVQQKGEK